ncbi:TraB/GumN family protein [Kiloniella sp. EL199]|uniref:TraB/GumN family protein n=1 Tax=Kiloniella sp. EL199 TaxID=2107581 RepID=UPI000EA25614|nr:TraB/GumN family protein [Kiloniella sp. EL199]
MSFFFYKFLRFVLLSGFLLTASLAWAENQVLYGKGLFWRIEKDGRKPSYLLGTMHVSDKRVLKMKDEVKPYLTKAKILYKEIANTHREYREYVNMRLRDDDRTLDQDLSEDDFKKAVETVKLIDIEEEDFKAYELWYVYEILDGAPWYRGKDKDPFEEDDEPVLDTQLGMMAFDHDVKVQALEKTRERALLLWDRPREMYLEAIKRALANTDIIENIKERRELQIQRYLSRDTQRMYNEHEERLKDEPKEIYDIEKVAMLDKRNLNMVNGMTKGLIKGNSFTAVGALHLPGEEGILNILVKRGYTVSRMDCDEGEKNKHCPNQDM